MPDPYLVLGLSQTADSSQVRRAYKSLALIFHPDKPTGSHGKFHDIAEAFSIIGDPIKREMYDIEQNHTHVQQAMNCTRVWTIPARIPTVLTVSVTINEILHGGMRKIWIPISVVCQSCHGTGAHDSADFITCLACHGSGVGMHDDACVSCGGEGGCNISLRCCPVCDGARQSTVNTCCHITIPRGAEAGLELVSEPRGIIAHVTHPLDLMSPRELDGHPGCTVALMMTPAKTYAISLTLQITLGELLCGFGHTLNVFGAVLTLSQASYDPIVADPKHDFMVSTGCVSSEAPLGSVGFDITSRLSILFPKKEAIAPFRHLLHRMLN